MPVTHTFVNAKADGSDATVTRPSDWNAAHVIELDYVQITGDVSITGTTEGTADTCITGTSIAYDGSTVVLIEVFSPQILTPTSASSNVVILLYDGGTVLGRLAVFITPAAAAMRAPLRTAYRLTPTNGSHQYIVKATVSSGTGTFSAGAGGTGASLPAFIRITKV